MNFQQIMIRLGVDGSAIGAGLSGVTARVKAWSWTVKEALKSTFSGTAVGNMGESVGRALAKASSMTGKVLRPVVTPVLNLIPFRDALTRGTASVRGWLTSTTHEMKTGMGKMFTGFLVFEGLKRGLEHIKDQIIEINRLSEETGASTNFVQSMMLQAKIAGVGLESLMVPMTKFNELIGRAKMGHVEAIAKLQEIGLASKNGAIGALTYEGAMKRLKESFDKAGNPAKQDAILFDAFGKSAYKLAPIFRQTSAEFDKMFEGNAFTKISTGSIEDFLNIWKAIKTTVSVVTASVTNLIDLPFKGYKELSKFVGAITGGARNWTQINAAMADSDDKEKSLTAQKQLANQADEDGISVQQEKVELQNKYLTLLEKQTELQDEIADQGKDSVEALADKTRRLMGIKSPKEIDHTVTKRGRIASQITGLEEKAELAWERGNDKLHDKLMSEATQIRAASPWLKRADRNPMQKTESELATVNAQLGPVKRMAELVTGQK